MSKCYICTFFGLADIQNFKQELKTGGKAFDSSVLKAGKPDGIDIEDLSKQLVKVFLDSLEAGIERNGLKKPRSGMVPIPNAMD